jgi:hypothetical protein
MTAKQNIEQVLYHLGLTEYIKITKEAEDRVFGWPSPELHKILQDRGWIYDPNLIAGGMHGTGSKSYREPEGVHPAMQIVFHPFISSLEMETFNPASIEFVEIDLDFSAPGIA